MKRGRARHLAWIAAACTGPFCPAPAAPQLVVQDFANYQVIQRNAGATATTVVVGGTCADLGGCRIEARVVRHGTQTPVLDWAPLAEACTGGSFTGTLAVPQGGWYGIEVRATDPAGGTPASSSGVNKWGVGMNILCIGQSNMSGCGRRDFPSYTSINSDFAANYSNAGRWERLADPYDDESPSGAIDNDNAVIGLFYGYAAGASMVPAIANALLARYGFPIGFVPAAKGGTTIEEWSARNELDHRDTTTLYGYSLTKAQRAGGVELIIMHHGEADAHLGTPAEQYLAGFDTLAAQYREDLRPGIPVFICHLGAMSGPSGALASDAGVSEVRRAQSGLDNGASVFLGATSMDLPRWDPYGLHYDPPQLDIMGARLAHSIRYYLGDESYYRGPSINEAYFTDARRDQVIVRIVHRGGADITPAQGITGFEVLLDNAGMALRSAVRDAPDQIRLVLASPVPPGQATLRYLYGAGPDVAGLVKDNSSLALPLENTAMPVPIAAARPTPLTRNGPAAVRQGPSRRCSLSRGTVFITFPGHGGKSGATVTCQGRRQPRPSVRCSEESAVHVGR